MSRCMSVIVLLTVASVRFCLAEDELQLDLPAQCAQAEHLDLLRCNDDICLVLSKSATEEQDGKTFGSIALMFCAIREGRLDPIERPYGAMFGFDNWSIISKTAAGCQVLATDVSGQNPLDKPDNALARLWMFNLDLAPAVQEDGHFPFAAKSSDRRQSLLGAKDAKVTSTYLNVGGTVESVAQIAAVLTTEDAGVCFGLSRKAAWAPESRNRDLDVLWLHEFSLKPLEWRRKGVGIKGSFRCIAAGLSDDGCFIAYLDGQDRPGVLRHRAHVEFDQANRDELQVDEKGVFVAVSPIKGIHSMFTLLMKDENGSKLLILQYSGKTKRWRTVQTIRISSTSGVSAAAMGGKVYYAYHAENQGKAVVKIGATVIPQE